MDNDNAVRMDGGPFRRIPATETISPLQADNVVGANDGNGTGGGSMDPKYATKDEFHALDKQVTQLTAKAEGQLETLNSKIDGRFNGLQKDVNHVSMIQWWLIGIVSAGIVIPLITLAVKAIFK